MAPEVIEGVRRGRELIFMSGFLTASIGGDDSQETVDNFPKIILNTALDRTLQLMNAAVVEVSKLV